MSNTRISNYNTFSTIIDRLISESIKLFFFEKEENTLAIEGQKRIIEGLKNELQNLIIECSDGYNCDTENRTFNIQAILESLDNLIRMDLYVGDSDRMIISESLNNPVSVPDLLSYIWKLRISNEMRSKSKNDLDVSFSKLFEKRDTV